MWVAVLFVLSIFGAQLVRVQAFDASGVQLAALNKRLNSVVVPAPVSYTHLTLPTNREV